MLFASAYFFESAERKVHLALDLCHRQADILAILIKHTALCDKLLQPFFTVWGRGQFTGAYSVHAQ